MTLREVLANRARRKMRLARESRESEIRPSRRRRLMESLEARRQNRFIESREAARVRNHYILVEDENEDDLVEIEPDTSVATAEEQPVEKDDVVKTLQDLAAQLGYDITPKAEAPAPVETPAPETDAPVTEEGQKCDDCQECKVTTEADEDNISDKGEEKSEDASAEDDKADGDAPEGEEGAGEDEPSDEDEKAEDDKEEEPVEIAPEDMPQDVEEVADLLSTIPNSTWNEIVGKILSGKEE